MNPYVSFFTVFTNCHDPIGRNLLKAIYISIDNSKANYISIDNGLETACFNSNETKTLYFNKQKP